MDDQEKVRPPQIGREGKISPGHLGGSLIENQATREEACYGGVWRIWMEGKGFEKEMLTILKWS